MKLAIVGLPQSGVTTVFNALTGRHRDPHAYAKPGQLNVAVVPMPDRRVDFLAGLYQPKKVTHATVEYLEVPGIFSASAGGATADSTAVATVRDADAVIKVLRNFDSDAAPNPRGANDPARDLRDINDELLMLDLAVIEKRIARLRKDVAKPTPEQEQNRIELAALERCLAAVEQGTSLGQVELTDPEARSLRGFGFLTGKPCLHVVNVNESDIASPDALAGVPPERAVAFCAEIEDEIEQLEPADQAAFLADLGIDELARDRLIRLSYDMLGQITFLTHNQDEVRAWALEAGRTAIEAAEQIHSDIARGFIRAEVIHFADLEELGSDRQVKARGKERLEGKDYVVQDGDILQIRFHV